MQLAPIVVVDDDADDLDIMRAVALEFKLAREVIYFQSGEELLRFLKTSDVRPFLIICDINMPGYSGFDVKKSITESKKVKHRDVPFVFWSTTASNDQISRGYSLMAQGVFVKPTDFYAYFAMFKAILNYWEMAAAVKV